MSWFFNKDAEISSRTDDWDFYFCLVDDKPASIFVDLGRIGRIPSSGFPIMMYLRLYMENPRSDGLSSNEDYQTLLAIEDGLEQKAQKQKLIYVGRNTTDGFRDFVFYGADPSRFSKAVKETMHDFTSCRYEIGHREDKDWSVYREFLYPAPIQYRHMLNRRVLQALKEAEDDETVPHKLDHRVYFEAESQRTGFMQEILRLGYEIEGESLSAASPDIYLDFFRTDQLDAVDAITNELEDLAARFGGNYDGWGTSVEKKSD